MDDNDKLNQQNLKDILKNSNIEIDPIWLYSFITSLITITSQQNTDNSMLEKEVSYLHEKIDTLEKMLFSK